MIVLTGATGAIGRHVLTRLVDAGEGVRVVTRSPQKIPRPLRERIEIVEGSHGDAAVITPALEGAESLFWLVAADPRAANPDAAFVEFARPAAAAVKRHGVSRIVTASSLGRGWPKSAGHVSATLRMDDLLAETGAALRALAIGSLMENVLRQAAALRTEGVYRWPSPPDLRAPNVAAGDVAAVGAAVLCDRAWRGVAGIPLVGDTLSFRDMAAVMSEALGRTIVYRQIPLEDMRALLTARGATADMAQGTLEILIAHAEGLYAHARGDPAYPTPTTFRAWCETVLRPAVLG